VARIDRTLGKGDARNTWERQVEKGVGALKGGGTQLRIALTKRAAKNDTHGDR